MPVFAHSRVVPAATPFDNLPHDETHSNPAGNLHRFNDRAHDDPRRPFDERPPRPDPRLDPRGARPNLRQAWRDRHLADGLDDDLARDGLMKEKLREHEARRREHMEKLRQELRDGKPGMDSRDPLIH